MSNLARERLMELIGDEGKVESFLETVEVRNRAIEDNGLITRDSESTNAENIDNEEAEADVDSEDTEEVEDESQDTEIVLDEESVGAIFEVFQPQIQQMVDTAVQAERTRNEKSVDDLQKRIAELEKEDGKKVREAVEDLPESRKRKNIVYRPSQQTLRDKESGEEMDEVEAVDVGSQIDKMLSSRKSRIATLKKAQ